MCGACYNLREHPVGSQLPGTHADGSGPEKVSSDMLETPLGAVMVAVLCCGICTVAYVIKLCLP